MDTSSRGPDLGRGVDRRRRLAALRSDLAEWCARELGVITDVQPLRDEMSQVLLAQLDDGRRVVIKVRPDPDGRAKGCLEVQHHAAAAGVPCPTPLTDLGRLAETSIHAESWCPGGEILVGDTRAAAERSARLLADVMSALASCDPRDLPLPNPDWVRWDYSGPHGWPPHVWIDAAPNQTPLPLYLDDAAKRVRRRMRRCSLPNVVGHGDWETQNLRWLQGQPFVIHDWDSVVVMPEGAIIGAAGAFASNEIPTLASIDSSAEFLDAYQVRRKRSFTTAEIEVAWAASLWPAIHNARAEFRFNLDAVAGNQLAEQADERLKRAGA